MLWMILGLIVCSEMVSAIFYIANEIKRRNNEWLDWNATGENIARLALNKMGAAHVRVETGKDDYFHPRKNAVFLSDGIRSSTDPYAVYVSVHECGHAEQEKEGWLLWRFNKWCALPAFLLRAAFLISFLCSIFSSQPHFRVACFASFGILWAYSLFVRFPIEIDANKRAYSFWKSECEDEEKRKLFFKHCVRQSVVTLLSTPHYMITFF